MAKNLLLRFIYNKIEQLVNDFFEILGTMRSTGRTIGPSLRILSQSGLTNIQKTVSVNLKTLMEVLTL